MGEQEIETLETEGKLTGAEQRQRKLEEDMRREMEQRKRKRREQLQREQEYEKVLYTQFSATADSCCSLHLVNWPVYPWQISPAAFIEETIVIIAFSQEASQLLTQYYNLSKLNSNPVCFTCLKYTMFWGYQTCCLECNQACNMYSWIVDYHDNLLLGNSWPADSWRKRGVPEGQWKANAENQLGCREERKGWDSEEKKEWSNQLYGIYKCST